MIAELKIHGLELKTSETLNNALEAVRHLPGFVVEERGLITKVQCSITGAEAAQAIARLVDIVGKETRK